MIIDPQREAARLVLNDPANAEHVINLILWASGEGVKESEEYREVLNMLYPKTDAYCEARDEYLHSHAA